MSFAARRIFSSNLLLRPTSNALLSTHLRYFSDEAVKWSNENLKEAVKKDKVVVFMKGVPEQPMCGFSNAVVQILKMHGVDNFGSYNILDDEELRSRIKEFSDWPTIPQVYINGEFVGGCDIMLQMHREGELIEELKKVGIKSALLEKTDQDSKDSS